MTKEGTDKKAVVIGASAGAVEALLAILPNLPPGFRLPVLLVVHIPPDQDSLLADLFSERCAVKVREAEDKEPLEAGTVYVAPPGYHLQVEKDMTASLSNDEPILFSRPSIDVLFETAADVFRDSLVGVILTGGSADGAQGMKAVAGNGGTAIVQDPGEALEPLMPNAALKACPGASVMTLREIVDFLKGLA
jgi:two-component system chemotaxis response regulator CheB